MAVNLSSSSPDGAQFITGIPNGHRSIDRSSSFRDSHEAGRTHGGGGGGNTPGPASDPSTLSQLLSLDPIPYAYGEQRNARQTELRRVTNAITGSLEDPSLPRPLDTLGAEEIRRVKTGVSELSARAKERSRHLSEAVAKLDRYRQSRKRFKPDTSSERVPGAPPADRNLTLKAASSSQVDGLKPAEKSKSLVPNKRLRTSIAGDGARPNSNLSMKKSADRESPRSSGVLPSPTPTDDKTRVPSEGWEKNKLKGRRSAIKTDSTIPPAGNGVIDGERDHKWSGQHRLSQEARPRSNDTHGLRSGPVHGVTSIHKTESSMQMNGTAARGATEGAGGDKVDRSFGTDKERLPKNGVKPPLQDDMHIMPGGSAVTKGKAARAPRSGSMSSGHFSHLNRVTAVSEKPQGTAKSQIPSGQGNRKRPASSIVQWVGQRPQKMARVARRVHVPPGGVLPAEDANSVPEAVLEREPSGTTGARLSSNINGVGGVSRRVPGTAHSPAQSKLRSERTVVVSESEESEEVSENKIKDKGKKYVDWDPRPATNHKSGGAVLPAKSSSLKEEVGDGVRRQGRSGRSVCMPKPVVTTIEKVDVATSTAKQFSARIEKADRPGRTPTKKATVDRKSVSRVRRPIAGSAPEIGDSDDYHEELVAAVRDAVEASAQACRSDFWKEMEPYFTFLTSDDISYLHQLADSKSSNDQSSLPANDGVQKLSHLANGNLEPEGGSDRLEIRTGGRTAGGGGWFDRIYPLSQRLLAALINEGEDEAGKSSDGDGFSTSIRDQSYAADGSYCSNGHGNNQSIFDGFADGDEIMADGNDFYAHLSGLKTEGRSGAWDSQYEHMNFDDRILFELQSIGLAVEQVPDLYQRDKDEICVEISKLKEELKDQASQNRQRVECLEKSIMSKRDEEIRERERLAISKLVENAYTRRKGCRGSSGGAGTKGAGNKGTRAAALASAKRAMARVHRFEAGHSILDPSLRDILLCNVPKSCETMAAANSVDTSGTPAASETSLPKSGGKLAMRRTDAKDKSTTEGNAEHVKGKDNSWSSLKEREVSPEDVTGATSVRNSHGGVGFGGAKGKRSERERDGKGQGKESHRKADNDRAPRQGIINKGERKTKTKPRQKAALFKDVNGLGKPAEAPRENSALVSASSVSAVQGEASSSVAAANLDLTIAEDLGVGTGLEQWFSSFSSSLEDTTLQDQGELLVGLDVPMDDLADLGMMM